MSETGKRLRSLFEEIAPPIEIGAIMAAPEAQPRRRGWLIAVAAAALTLVVGVAGWLVVALRDGGPATTEPGPANADTTSASGLAGFGLDALAAFQARPLPAEATCPAGSTPDVPGDPAAPRPVSYEAFSQSLVAFDRESGLLVQVIEPRGESEPGRFETWTFDPCRNRWQEVASAGLDSVGRLSGLTYDTDSDLTVGLDEAGTVWAYDADAGTWTARPWAVGKAALPTHWPAIYDGASGLIVFHSPWSASAWAYDVDTDARYEITPMEAPAGELVYDPVGGRYYVFTGSAAVPWRWERGDGWVELGLLSPAVLYAPGGKCGMFDLEGGPIALDEATGRFVVFCRGAAMAAFDPTSTAWEVLAGDRVPEPDAYRRQAVYDSANDRLILVGEDLWAYDGPTGEWIELLAAAG